MLTCVTKAFAETRFGIFTSGYKYALISESQKYLKEINSNVSIVKTIYHNRKMKVS
jgi:hypothetical protein